MWQRFVKNAAHIRAQQTNQSIAKFSIKAEMQNGLFC